MKKKIDAMTVISIVLIVIMWIVVIFDIFGDCGLDDEFEMSLINFEQLFGGIVYANNAGFQMNIVDNSPLNGIMRDCIRNSANDSLYLVLNFSGVSDNKIYPIKKY